tara:strand:- start:1250 stop:1486 length:237 start_codon:yes stop_codon:yes gene_type:complete
MLKRSISLSPLYETQVLLGIDVQVPHAQMCLATPIFQVGRVGDQCSEISIAEGIARKSKRLKGITLSAEPSQECDYRT